MSDSILLKTNKHNLWSSKLPLLRAAGCLAGLPPNMFSLEKTSFIGVGATVLADELSLFEISEGEMFLSPFF